jgi:hypothetical protein
MPDDFLDEGFDAGPWNNLDPAANYPVCPSCGNTTRPDASLLMCDHCKRAVGWIGNPNLQI